MEGDLNGSKLKRLLTDAMLDNAALKDLLGKNGDARKGEKPRRSIFPKRGSMAQVQLEACG